MIWGGFQLYLKAALRGGEGAAAAGSAVAGVSAPQSHQQTCSVFISLSPVLLLAWNSVSVRNGLDWKGP